MAAHALRARRFAPHTAPNVIPFIDILLVLLVIFMVTAPTPTTDLKLDLPRPGVSAPLIPPTIIEVRPGSGGFVALLDGEEVALDELGRRILVHVLASNPGLTPQIAHAEARVYVRADLDVAYQHVVAVLETIQMSRFRNVAILAQRADARAG